MSHKCGRRHRARSRSGITKSRASGRGLQGKPQHSGAGELQRVKQRNIQQGVGWNGVESSSISSNLPMQGGYRQGEMLIGGLMSSEKAALPLRMKDDPHDQRYGKPRAATKRHRTIAYIHSRPKRPKDTEHDDVEFVPVNRRIGSAVIQDDEVQHVAAASGRAAAAVRRCSR